MHPISAKLGRLLFLGIDLNFIFAKLFERLLHVYFLVFLLMNHPILSMSLTTNQKCLNNKVNIAIWNLKNHEWDYGKH